MVTVENLKYQYQQVRNHLLDAEGALETLREIIELLNDSINGGP